MTGPPVEVVTGAFGFTGRYLTRRLLATGRRVKTLTGHPDRPHPFGDRVRAEPFHFDAPAALADSLRGVSTLYNTYWVRFNRGPTTFEAAVANTRALFRAAAQAGVGRVVHVSIANPSLDSPLAYYRGKAALEQALVESGLSYAIVRPTVVFGDEDILINNMAWLLRRFPVFAVPGAGDYRLQPIFVEDLAGLMLDAGGRSENLIVDAVGPEVFAFGELVRLIKKTVRSRSWIVHLPPRLGLFLSQLVGAFVGDVVITRQELDGLIGNLLVSSGPPTGRTRLSAWLAAHAGAVGARYASEVARHYR